MCQHEIDRAERKINHLLDGLTRIINRLQRVGVSYEEELAVRQIIDETIQRVKGEG